MADAAEALAAVRLPALTGAYLCYATYHGEQGIRVPLHIACDDYPLVDNGVRPCGVYTQHVTIMEYHTRTGYCLHCGFALVSTRSKSSSAYCEICIRHFLCRSGN